MQLIIDQENKLDWNLARKDITKITTTNEAELYIQNADKLGELVFVEESVVDVENLLENHHKIFISAANYLGEQKKIKGDISIYFDLELSKVPKKMLGVLRERNVGNHGVFRMRKVGVDDNFYEQATEDIFILTDTFGKIENVYSKVARNPQSGVSHAIFAVTFSNKVIAHLEYSCLQEGSVGFEIEWSGKDLIFDLPPNGNSHKYSINSILTSARKADSETMDQLLALQKMVQGSSMEVGVK